MKHHSSIPEESYKKMFNSKFSPKLSTAECLSSNVEKIASTGEIMYMKKFISEKKSYRLIST